MQTIHTDQAPAPAGHYAQAVVHAGLVYVSGQLPAGAGDGSLGSFEDQASRVLANLEAILRAAGSSRDRVVRVTVYLADVELWGQFNAVYAAFFGDHRPARTVVPTGPLRHGCALELDAVAAVAG